VLARARALLGAIVLVAVGVFAPVAPLVQPVAATSITVNTATDPAPSQQTGNFPTNGLCSLRAAILSAVNNSNSADAD
jgi:hypothetical protein